MEFGRKVGNRFKEFEHICIQLGYRPIARRVYHWLQTVDIQDRERCMTLVWLRFFESQRSGILAAHCLQTLKRSHHLALLRRGLLKGNSKTVTRLEAELELLMAEFPKLERFTPEQAAMLAEH